MFRVGFYDEHWQGKTCVDNYSQSLEIFFVNINLVLLIYLYYSAFHDNC